MRAAFVGGSSGIGLATARLAVDAGRDVVILSRDPERADIDAERVALDIADETAVRETFAALGPVDHLVLSPVARAGGPAKSLDLATARTAFETKFWGRSRPSRRRRYASRSSSSRASQRRHRCAAAPRRRR